MNGIISGVCIAIVSPLALPFIWTAMSSNLPTSLSPPLASGCDHPARRLTRRLGVDCLRRNTATRARYTISATRCVKPGANPFQPAHHRPGGD